MSNKRRIPAKKEDCLFFKFKKTSHFSEWTGGLLFIKSCYTVTGCRKTVFIVAGLARRGSLR